MKRVMEISVGRLLSLCLTMMLVGVFLGMLAWQVKQGESVLVPLLGISGLLIATGYQVFAGSARRI